MQTDAQFLSDRLFGPTHRTAAQDVGHRTRWEVARGFEISKRPEFDSDFRANFLWMQKSD